MNIITLAHGSGGEKSSQLVKDLFISKFNNKILNQLNDSAVINIGNSKIAFTTDSFVINPLFFPGGDIGKLAVCGTVNDLSMSGAQPIALSCGFIIEEGLEISILEKVVQSMKKTCDEAGVEFVTGDTKIVNKGAVDKLFINTSGIGLVDKDIDIGGNKAQKGDKIIVSGSIGEHGASVILARDGFGLESNIKSDVAPLNGLVKEMLKVSKNIRVLRDPTRGGLATTLNEIAEQSNVEIEIDEQFIPIKNNVKGLCEILGLDPLYLACEGRLVAVVPDKESDKILDAMRKHKYGKGSKVIGRVKGKYDKGRVYLITKIGGNRIINKLGGDFLPRIC